MGNDQLTLSRANVRPCGRGRAAWVLAVSGQHLML